MGTTHRVTQDDQTALEIMKKKQQMQFLEGTHRIRQVEGDVELEYQILSPALVSNDFYEIRKSINRRTKICKSMFIINKYRVRSQQRELFQQQISKLKEIDNPYLLKIYELHKDRHRFYIICEFCYGQSLAEVLAEEGAIPERKAALIMHQLLSALSECHRNNVIHTDMKLENITFNSKEEEVVKITDFSISRIFRIEDVITQCQKKAFLAAPETLCRVPVSKSDIWSCGIIMYIILSAHIPIVGGSIKRMKQKTENYSPNFANENFKDISKEAKQLIRMMLNENWELRPSAEECLSHPWFEKFYHPPRISDSAYKRILREGIYFNPRSKLQEAVWGLYVNAFISFDEKQEIIQAFTRLDRGNKSQLSLEDIKEGLIGFYGRKKATSLASSMWTTRKDKPIRFSEFLAMSTDKKFLINNENTKNLFLMFDQNEDGSIEVSQLKELLGNSKEVPLEIWESLMKEGDQNSDGVISLEELTHLMDELKPVTPTQSESSSEEG